jgi:hypothetical protein
MGEVGDDGEKFAKRIFYRWPTPDNSKYQDARTVGKMKKAARIIWRLF